MLGSNVLDEFSSPLRTELQLSRLAAGRRGPAENFQFAVLGDAEPGRFWWARRLFNTPGAFERQLSEIQTRPVDFSIQLGDMVSRGIHRNYERFFHLLSGVSLRVPYLTVIGNHDRVNPHRKSSSALYRACFGPTNYSFDHGGARFVVLDTSSHGLTRRQLKWLDLVLRTDLRKVVFTHIPPACLLRRWTDFIGARGLGGFRPGAEEFSLIVSRRAVDRVCLGHIHCFGVQDHLGVRYVLTGGGGSPLFPGGTPDRFHHYLVATVSGRDVSETVYSADGGQFDIPQAKVLI